LHEQGSDQGGCQNIYVSYDIICGQFIFLLGQPVSELQGFSGIALRLCGYFCDFCFVIVSENKYDDDNDNSATHCQLAL